MFGYARSVTRLIPFFRRAPKCPDLQESTRERRPLCAYPAFQGGGCTPAASHDFGRVGAKSLRHSDHEDLDKFATRGHCRRQFEQARER